MDFDDNCYDDYNIQEDYWEDGFDGTQDSTQEAEPPPEPRKIFPMPWQAVLYCCPCKCYPEAKSKPAQNTGPRP